MIFNTSKKYDFPPEFSFKNGEGLEVVDKTSLMGVYITSDLRWHENTKNIYMKAMKRMWLLRRLKLASVEPQFLIDFFVKEIRILAEHGVAIWNSGLTLAQVNMLEKIQKVALRIILGDTYLSYDKARAQFNLKLLSERRLELCTNFALKLFESKHRETFYTTTDSMMTTRHRNILVENFTNTRKCYLAPHNYLARLVNPFPLVVGIYLVVIG